MTTFILVHGAWHGAWSWSRVASELELAGHRALMSDLPCDDPGSSWDDYAQRVLEDSAACTGDLVLVGHSLGGGVIPIVATKLPASRMVIVCSLPPEPGRSLNDVVAEQKNLTDKRAAAFRESIDDRGRYLWRDFEAARYAMYNDCAESDARRAFGLLRPQSPKPFADVWPLSQWPGTPLTFIVCSEDRMGNPSCLAEVAKRRFGVDAVYLEGSHSPLLSRPRELVGLLLRRSEDGGKGSATVPA